MADLYDYANAGSGVFTATASDSPGLYLYGDEFYDDTTRGVVVPPPIKAPPPREHFSSPPRSPPREHFSSPPGGCSCRCGGGHAPAPAPAPPPNETIKIVMLTILVVLMAMWAVSSVAESMISRHLAREMAQVMATLRMEPPPPGGA